MKKVGRNQPCPCGSGRKYKLCCIAKDTQVENESTEAAKRRSEDPFVTYPDAFTRAIDRVRAYDKKRGR